MTANERRKELLEVLCERRKDTRENLAKDFGVSKRTIEYDVIALSCEYPINTKQGKGGFIYVEDWFDIHKGSWTDEQYELLNKLKAELAGKDKQIIESILKKCNKPKAKHIKEEK